MKLIYHDEFIDIDGGYICSEYGEAISRERAVYICEASGVGFDDTPYTTQVVVVLSTDRVTNTDWVELIDELGFWDMTLVSARAMGDDETLRIGDAIFFDDRPANLPALMRAS